MTDTPTPDTTPAAVEAMCERLDVFEDWLYAMDMAGLSEVQPNLHDTAAMLREVARERDKTRAAIESQASAIRNLRANEESEINILRSRSRDHYIATATLDSEREANARLTDALLAAEAEAAALREALREIEALEIDWRLSTAENMRAASRIARAALKVSGHD